VTEVVTYRPNPDELSYTFGGREAVRRVKPATILELYTEDCFGGRVRTVDDLPSQVCEFPYLNPQTGPFYIEGAQPGDTLAVHFVSIEPARDWAASTTVPLFGVNSRIAGRFEFCSSWVTTSGEGTEARDTDSASSSSRGGATLAVFRLRKRSITRASARMEQEYKLSPARESPL